MMQITRPMENGGTISWHADVFPDSLVRRRVRLELVDEHAPIEVGVLVCSLYALVTDSGMRIEAGNVDTLEILPEGGDDGNG